MKTVLITGAYGGMGREMAALLKNNGYRVFALDYKIGDPEENIIPIQADVTKEESVISALEKVREYTDRLDVIVHFAGVYFLDSLVEMSDDSFKKIFDVNLRGAFLINKTFLPLMRSGSRIIMTTSELAPLDPLPFTGIYAISKSALDKYAFSLRMELQLLNIKVSVVRAGAVSTQMLGVSTAHLDRFCEETKIYSCNAKRFKSIVNKVEARCIPPSRVAEKCARIIKKRQPKFAYKINRNPLLLLLNVLPQRLQFWIIKMILK